MENDIETKAQNKIGQYTLIRQIAEGGMAEIWLAEQRGPGGFNKEVVIKKILPHLAGEGQMTQMFFDEARTVARLNHPNVGQVYELGEDEGDYYIAMEFIDGIDLSDLVQLLGAREQRMPIPFAARITADILKALEYAHGFRDREGNHVGLIHRDISPHNVLISNEGIVKLVDFGIAKSSTNEHKTQTGAVKGKFAYMAPEQIENQDLDHRADIFAVGVVLYELITGDKPFGDELTAVSQILVGEYDDPRQRRADIPRAIGDIVDRALSVNPEDRFQTAAAMDEALESYILQCGARVGNRELSTMVHQVRGLENRQPTEQLFGFESQGVAKAPPTMKEPTPAPVEAQNSGAAVGDVEVEEAGQGEREGAEDKKSGPKWIIAAAVMVVAMFIALVIAGAMIIQALEPEAPAGEGSAAMVSELEYPSLVYLTGPSKERVEWEGRELGRLPLQTFLEPGSYALVVGEEGASREVELQIEEGPSVQRLTVNDN